MKSILSDQRGFTFIELLAVLIILVLIGSIVTKKILGRVAGARRDTAVVQIKNIEGALKMFKLDNGFYPTSDQGLEALVSAPAGGGKEAKNWNADGYLDKVPLDPWGNPYFYISPGNFNPDYDIMSLGADGAEGGEGADADVKSWEIE